MSKPLRTSDEHKRREAAQRRAVHKRDYEDGRPYCRFQFWNPNCEMWIICGSEEAHDVAHIYRRHNCSQVWDHPDVAILGCRECHTKYDAYQTTVRVPPDREAAAWAVISANSKVLPPRLIPPKEPV